MHVGLAEIGILLALVVFVVGAVLVGVLQKKWGSLGNPQTSKRSGVRQSGACFRSTVRAGILQPMRWVLTLMVLLSACDGTTAPLRWEVEFESETDRERAVRVLGFVRTGDCDGDDVYRVSANEEMPDAPVGLLRPGEYGFVTEAFDADCTLFARSCDIVQLPTEQTLITSRLSPVPEQTCPAGRCSDAVCSDPDSGSDAPDAADTSADTSTDADTDPDTTECGGCDPCEECVDGMCVVADDGTSCESGTCVSGACCTTCVEDGFCRRTTTSGSCGSGGALCDACPCDGDTCSADGLCAPRETATDVSVGYRSVCAIATGPAIQRLVCWGSNSNSQLGRGDVPDTNVPTTTIMGTSATQLASGTSHHLALQADGSVVGWGSNQSLQLGIDGEMPVPTPESLAHATSIALVASYGGGSSSCTVTTSGTLRCFGANRSGEASGRGSMREPEVLPQVIQVPAGGLDAIAMPVDARREDAGGDAGGPGGDTGWATATIGGGHACAITTGGRLYCWGSNSTGEVGVGSNSPSEVRSVNQVRPGTTWEIVKAASSHTCAIDTTGALWCWGSNRDRQLAAPSAVTLNNEPRQVGGATGWQSVGVGSRHTCGLRDNRVSCWGNGSLGELGDPGFDPEDLYSAVPLEIPGSYTRLSVGRGTSCAIDLAGALFCWGRGDAGQIGNGASENAPVPTRTCFP